MKIKTLISQSRRDFTADYECESCGNVERGTGYDDANFHQNVIPSMKCKKCGVVGGKVTSSPTVPAGVTL
jgi:ribosomal protein L37AE/L43A